MATTKKNKTEARAVATMVPKVKFVRAANMWCRTYRDDKGTQKQEWSTNAPKE